MIGNQALHHPSCPHEHPIVLQHHCKLTDVTKTRNGERGTGNGERKSNNQKSAVSSIKIQKMADQEADQETGKIDDGEASKQHLRSLFY